MSYWNFEFSAIWLSVLGVDFVFAAGSLFISKFALPYEQSMAGALFTAMSQVCFFWYISGLITTGSSSLVQLGIAFGIAVTTVVFNGVTLARSPGADKIVSYHAANWTSVAFCLIGMPDLPLCSYMKFIIFFSIYS